MQEKVRDFLRKIRLKDPAEAKEFRFKMSVGGRMLVDDSGWLSEEIRMPPMGGGDR